MQKKPVTFINHRDVNSDDARPSITGTLRALPILKQSEIKLVAGQVQYVSDIKVAAGFNLSESVSVLESAHRRYQEFRTEILKQYARLDKNDQVMTNKDLVLFKSKADEMAAKAAIGELDSTEVPLELWTFDFGELFKDLENATRPPDVWEYLRWMIT